MQLFGALQLTRAMQPMRFPSHKILSSVPINVSMAFWVGNAKVIYKWSRSDLLPICSVSALSDSDSDTEIKLFIDDDESDRL